MQEVNVYTYVSVRDLSRRDRAAGYLLEAQTSKGPEKRAQICSYRRCNRKTGTTYHPDNGATAPKQTLCLKYIHRFGIRCIRI